MMYGPKRPDFAITFSPTANLHVIGNVFASNALVSNSVITTTLNVLTLNTSFVSSVTGIANSAPTSTLSVTGNIRASNSIFVGNSISASTSNSSTTLNTTSINNASGKVGINVNTGLVATLHVNGDTYVVGNAQFTGGLGVAGALSSLIPLANANTINTESFFAGTSSKIGINTNTGLGANLHVLGNVYASNAYQGQLFGGTTNIATINTAFINEQTGIGTASAAGATLRVQGNIYATSGYSASNVLLSGSVNSTTINTTSIFAQLTKVGFNTTSADANLHVIGNVYASNALQTPTVVVTTQMNVATMNTDSIFSTKIGVNTSNPGASLHVVGNVYASNLIDGTLVITSNIIPTTLNVNYLYNSIENRNQYRYRTGRKFAYNRKPLCDKCLFECGWRLFTTPRHSECLVNYVKYRFYIRNYWKSDRNQYDHGSWRQSSRNW